RFDRNSNITCSNHCFNEFTTPFASLIHDVNVPYNVAIQSGNKAFPSIEPIVGTPRTGVAWSVTKTTTIRAGIGIFSDLYQGLIADRFLVNSPSVASFSTSSGLVAPGSGSSVFANVANSANAFRSGYASGATLARLKQLVPLGFAAPNFN